MSSTTGFELLLLAANLSNSQNGAEEGSSVEAEMVCSVPTVGNFEEVGFSNTLLNNTFLDGVADIVSSTPIKRSGLISFSAPEQKPALDLSTTMIEDEEPLNLKKEAIDDVDNVPLDLAMPKKDIPTTTSTGKVVNLCITKSYQGSGVPSSDVHQEELPLCRLGLLAGTNRRPSCERDQKPTYMDHSGAGRNSQPKESTFVQFVDQVDQKPAYCALPDDIDDHDTDSESEIDENITTDGLTEHAVSQYFEPYANRTLISSDESSDDNACEAEDEQVDNDHALAKNCAKRPAWVIRKIRRERGLKYQRTNGTFAPARCIKKPCQCARLKCYSKYNDALRKDILKNLLKLSSSGQNQFIGSHVIVKPTTRTRVINSRRTATRIYHLPALNGQNRVCKQMFLNTLDIGDKKVRWLAMKSVANGGICPDDMRVENRNPNSLTEQEIGVIKEHISSFPSSESHYSREKSSKRYLSSDLSVAKMYELYKEQCAVMKTSAVHYNTYRKVFRSINLSFRKPRIDTCNTCDEMQTRLRLATEDEKPPIKKELEIHHQNAQFVYDQKRSDIEKAKNSDDTWTISFDLQKALATPSLNCGEVYYLRQMYTYNLTVFVSTKSRNEAICYLWDESQARRGAQEIGSCLFKFLLELPNNIKFLHCYSDRCFGQNFNTIICSMFSAFTILCIEQKRELTFTHNFMVSGHSHMECDSVHSSIERAKKRTPINIEIRKDWSTFISGIRRKVPFKVVEMGQEDFLALKQLETTFKKPTCDNNGDHFKFQKVMCFKYKTTLPGCIEFKYSTSNANWSKCKFAEANISPMIMPGPINNEPICLPQAKLDDLRKQLKYIKNKAYYETFLKEIVPKKRGRKSVNHGSDNFEDDMDKDLFEEEEINVTIILSNVYKQSDHIFEQ